METLNIIKHKGEISDAHECEYVLPFKGELLPIEGSIEEVFYEVNVSLAQEETSTELHVNKLFDNLENAMNYLKMFTDVNPTSEGIIIKKQSTELYYYI